MTKYNQYTLLMVLIWFSGLSSATAQELRYDAKKNGVILYGPYLKYNFLSPPFSFGLSEFKKSDLSLKVIKENDQPYLLAQWPSYFLKSGKISIYDSISRRKLKRSVSLKNISESKGVVSHRMKVPPKNSISG